MAAIPELYTVDALATEICEAFGSSQQADRDKAYRAINRAIRIIARKGRWPFFRLEDTTLLTVSGQENYKLKSSLKLPDYIHMRDPAVKLKMVDLRVLRRLFPNNTVLSGTPRFWRMVNFDSASQSYQIALWPIPSGVFTLYIDADQNPVLPTDKNDDIRNTGIPEEMIETIINLAIAIMFEKYDDEKYQAKMAKAEAMLDDDYYRLGNHPDDDLTSRQYNETYSDALGDPQLDPKYS